ncbi:unnamed protein product [Victoria cruziana]
MYRRGCSSLIFSVALLLPLGAVHTVETPFWLCTGKPYAANSTYARNLQRALASLAADVLLEPGFCNLTVGNSPDQVLAVAGCRGDLDGEACQVCVDDAVSRITQSCPNNRMAFIIFQGCAVHCRDADSTIPQTLMSLSIPGPQSILDPERFELMLTFFFDKLIDSATNNPSGRLFCGDKFRYTQNLTIYGIAQCVQYLPPEHCRSCLVTAFGQMLRDAGDRTGGIVYRNVECFLKFRPFPIFTPPHTVAPSSGIFISTNCSPPAARNETGSPFHRNLKALLSYLILHAPASSGFYSDSLGLLSGQVYGQALCRGDVPSDDCWECIGQASTTIQQLCPHSRRATIWLDHCQLRYSDENFVGIVDVSDRACKPTAESGSNPVSFYQNLRILIANLTSMVTQSPSDPFFVAGVSVLAEAKRIYAMVQCVRDIPADQCRRCLQNASSDIEGCFNGKQGGRILTGSCSLAFGLRPFFSGNPIVVSLPPPRRRQKHGWILVAVIGFVGGLLLAGTCALCFFWRRKKRIGNHVQKKQEEPSPIHADHVKEYEERYDLPHISLKTLEAATDNFSKSNKLGEGGYGSVYRGKLADGQEVAVKRMSGRSIQGLKEFRNEVESIAKLQHINLVRLIGCCLEEREKILIYEYMPNKSLDLFLKDQESRALLDWGKRFDIILGVARGMLYLHQDSRLNFIHRDLKASNVLLDDQLNPKISDFGLARIFSGVQGQATTSVIVGTFGYMAPEYAMDGVFSTKSDVYSFGILVLEIISGQLNTASICLSYDGRSLIEHGWSLWCEQKKAEFIDPLLKEEMSASDQMLRCLQVGFLCIQEEAAIRPTMSRVVLMLGNDSMELPLPSRPAFIGESASRSSRRRPSTSRNVVSEGTVM